MGLFDWFKRKEPNYDWKRVVSSTTKATGIKRNKQTLDKWEQQFFWYEGTIPRNELKSKDVMESLKVIRDINPDASMAIWNLLRLANSGHTLEVEKVTGTVDKKATEYCNELARTVGSLYGGGVDQLINVLLLTGFTQGAIALEVELDDGLDGVVDFHAVDPSSLDFRTNKETGVIELVQKQKDGNYKVLNQETVFYFPFDPDVADPFGRSPILPILQIIFFQTEVLKDLKRVIHHQGHQRFDIKVLETAIIENMPDDIKFAGQEAVRNFVMDYVSDIQQQMEELEPDDDFFHTDSVEIDMAGGAIGQSLDATRVIDIINQQVVTALKQLPILLGRNEGSTETHGTIQWQIYVKGIESLQRGIKRLLEKAYNVSLQVGGIQGTAKITFDKIQVTDRLNDAQAERTETETKIQQVNQGWIDNNEAALAMVGHEAVSEPKKPEPVKVAVPKVPKDEEPEEEEQEDDEQRSILKGFFSKKKRTDEDITVDTDHEYVKDLEDLTSESVKSFLSFMKRQRDIYINRLKEAPEIPTSVLLEATSMRSVTRVDKPSPPSSLEDWVNVYILYDSLEQMEMWIDEEREWIANAAILSGMQSLLEITTEIEFNERDARLLRWITERSRRSCQLIQGVTDNDVLMTLWDVIYEGSFSINKAREALENAYSFSSDRAETIARTEILSAGRAGQFHADVQSGMVIGKKWMAANQERTRDHHKRANGQVVKLDEPFIVDGEPLMFPGDSSLGAGAGNTINCRCWYMRILEGEELE